MIMMTIHVIVLLTVTMHVRDTGIIILLLFTVVRFHLGHLFEMQNKCDLAQEMYEAIIETPNVPNNVRANAYKQLGK